MDIKIVKGIYDSNTFVVQSGEMVVVVDSGATPADVAKALRGRTVSGILVTHEHFDHLTNCAEYARQFNAPVFGSKEVLDNLKYYKPVLYGDDGVGYDIAMLCGKVRFVDIYDESGFLLDGVMIEPILAPGHSPGSIIYKINNNLFTGDVLFQRSIGNSTFMTNGRKYMVETLKRLQGVEFETAHHGHGESSSYADQQKNISIWLKWLNK